ncbi:microsomal glutathione S-transferase 2-like [Haliotis rubra]|uniref:microsomal glutathione S-transferase 2-like n=1 Tax=Haliotis rubra TaxID=36100 RepID=UPI001EE590C2|nr:microsomal glutathione S-transferase 2-like [Haliotis rubra]
MSEVNGSFLRVENLLWPGVVTLISGFQLTRLAIGVGAARKKHKVAYPAVSGDPAFERAFRAQMNTLEFHPIFMTCLWVSSIFFHPGVSAGVGLIYVYSREKYFKGYCQSVEGRLPGFILGVKCLQILLVTGAAGLITVGLRHYTGTDLASIARSYISKVLPIN